MVREIPLHRPIQSPSPLSPPMQDPLRRFPPSLITNRGCLSGEQCERAREHTPARAMSDGFRGFRFQRGRAPPVGFRGGGAEPSPGSIGSIPTSGARAISHFLEPMDRSSWSPRYATQLDQPGVGGQGRQPSLVVTCHLDGISSSSLFPPPILARPAGLYLPAPPASSPPGTCPTS
jgi:hypothetical protein